MICCIGGRGSTSLSLLSLLGTLVRLFLHHLLPALPNGVGKRHEGALGVVDKARQRLHPLEQLCPFQVEYRDWRELEEVQVVVDVCGDQSRQLFKS